MLCSYPDITIDGNEVLFDRILADVPCSGDGRASAAPPRFSLRAGNPPSARSSALLHDTAAVSMHLAAWRRTEAREKVKAGTSYCDQAYGKCERGARVMRSRSADTLSMLTDNRTNARAARRRRANERTDRRSESLRKNLDLWRTWNSTMGGALHRLQVQILRRAAEVLRAAMPAALNRR